MAEPLTNGSSSSDSKPVIVRVKRKAFQTPLDAFWLEIQERPSKRTLLDFGKLSISADAVASSSKVEELKTKKVLVQHVETVTSSEDTFDVLRSFVPKSSDELKSKENNEERRRSFKTLIKQDQVLVKAKQRQQILSRNARFEQIWRSRKDKKEAPEDEAVYEMCRLYDVIRVDTEENEVETQKKRDEDLDDCRLMAKYLPLLKEVLPTAVEEIEHDIHDKISKHDGFVYDVYAVREDDDMMEADSANLFPLVQVEEDDFYDGPDDESEYESDDSNAENNPMNDYPDEESSEDDDEVTSGSSNGESEGESTSSDSESEQPESGSQESDEDKFSGPREWSDDEDDFY